MSCKDADEQVLFSALNFPMNFEIKNYRSQAED
jgi:hypothetical protein